MMKKGGRVLNNNESEEGEKALKGPNQNFP